MKIVQWLLIGGPRHGEVVNMAITDGPADYPPNDMMWRGQLYRLGAHEPDASHYRPAEIGALIDAKKVKPL